jgi:hypothetical protein
MTSASAARRLDHMIGRQCLQSEGLNTPRALAGAAPKMLRQMYAGVKLHERQQTTHDVREPLVGFRVISILESNAGEVRRENGASRGSRSRGGGWR